MSEKDYQVYHGKSELKAKFLHINATDPWIDVNSAPRKVMYSGQLSQALLVSGAEERYWQTGAEARFGEYTVGVKAPCDMEVIRVIKRFPKGMGGHRFKNPQTVVIYRDLSTRKVGCLDLRDYSLKHSYFGFDFVKTPEYHAMISSVRGTEIQKDTPFLVSPALKSGGGHGLGVNLRFGLISHESTADDGVWISQSALEKLAFNLYEVRDGSWGATRFPLNLHGTTGRPKVMKDVGEMIRPDGLLMTFRDYDERLSITNMGIYDTQIVDMCYDDRLYTRPGEGEVIDIRVFHDNRSLPNGTSEQLNIYREMTDRFYREILNTYEEQKKLYGGKQRFITNEFHRLIVEALAMTDYDIGEPVQKLYHRTPTDDCRVEITTKYLVIPNIGNKITGAHGNKGIVVNVSPDHHMPVNDHGVRMDVAMSVDSPVNRQNFGVMYESYFNQATREILNVWTEKSKIDRSKISMDFRCEKSSQYVFEEYKAAPNTYDRIWEDMIKLYSILSPAMHAFYTKPRFDDMFERAKRLTGIFRPNYECIHILAPTDNMPIWRKAVTEIAEHFPPRVTPVTYVDHAGNYVRTKKPVEIGHIYIFNLEKISDDWLAASTAKMQHMQVLGTINSSDKFANPVKIQGVKTIAEAELRSFLSYCGQEVSVDLMSRNNSIPAHQEVVRSIMDTDTPTNIERCIDRSKIPFSSNNALSLLKHIFLCNGYKVVHTKYVDKDRP